MEGAGGHKFEEVNCAFLYHCNLSPNDKVIDTITSTVVRDWVSGWCTYNFNKNPEEDEICTHIIWHNSILKTKKIVFKTIN